MAKPSQKFSSVQPDLFQQLEAPAMSETAYDLDVNLELMGALNQTIREAKRRGLSRERIVERMNLCLPDLDRRITLRQLNSWTAASKEYHEFPARYLPAFCWATGSILPLLVLAQSINHDLVDLRDQVALELGQKLVAKAQLSREVSQLRKILED